MRPDEISAVAKNDILICLYGETHLKKHKRAQIATVISNKMRELSRLLIALRKITPVKNLFDAMKPEYFDDILAATKVISGFNVADKTFKASSLALHMGTSLKLLCDIVDRHILKKSPLFSIQNAEQERRSIKSLRKLIETSWASEIASLALKRYNRKTLGETSNNSNYHEVEQAAVGLANMIREGKEDDTKELILLYKKLAKGIMALVLVLNRKRIDTNNQEEILKSLSTSERVVCKNFKRVVSGGKGSKPVPILFSPYIQQKINFMLDIRKKINEIPKSNDYIFANPHSSKGWFHGTSVIRSFAVSCKASSPSSLTSTKFRKQTATILQVMNLSENDMEQLALFMGHTKKTHEEWYRVWEVSIAYCDL
ncbi:hypothetical protein NQ317_011989 [Molorchus minor]|uniref:Uncharacterized protein n=1 Tax=Molorchus minor TaxID=1323400 RepID=A0ABQ9JAF9_9CUCU|nr:hypothetical protein NQ317_011989 [Molorchus minor]